MTNLETKLFQILTHEPHAFVAGPCGFIWHCSHNWYGPHTTQVVKYPRILSVKTSNKVFVQNNKQYHSKVLLSSFQ